jgi:hypothetical protein
MTFHNKGELYLNHYRMLPLNISKKNQHKSEYDKIII